jgi:hypothetical protein
LKVPATSLSDLTAKAAAAAEPDFVVATIPKLGGVDPLGMRQINFDLMDQVLPGINNVARHIRPFVVVTWAWRRAKQIAEAQGLKEIPVDRLRDFVDRIEVLYGWSQFLRNPNADLPGQQVLSPFIKSDHYVFGGKAWKKLRENRRYSTAFTAPITYGPSLKTLGWLTALRENREVLIPTPVSVPALVAFEARIKRHLTHPAFSRFGTITVTKREVAKWSNSWVLEEVTEPEKRVMAEMLLGMGAPLVRRQGCQLMIAALKQAHTTNVKRVRRVMTGAPSNFHSPARLDGAFENVCRMRFVSDLPDRPVQERF